MNKNDVDNLFCVSVVAHMKRLLTGRDFVGAVECFEANRSQIDTQVGGSVAGQFLHLAAQAYASLTNYTAALKMARTAQSYVASSGDSLLLAEIFVTLGGILRDRGEHAEALKAYRDAESIFRRNDYPEGQARALNHLAGLFFRRTEYRNALSVLMDAVVIAKQLDDRQKLAFMMGNIGRIHTFMGDFAEAEKHLRINVELSSELGDDLETLRAHLSLGYLQLQRAEYSAARLEFKQAEELLVTANSPRDEIILMTYVGELEYRAGSFEDAQAVLQNALERAELIASGTTLAGRVRRQLAELHVRTGNYRLARKLAVRAGAIMEQAGEQVELGAVKKLMAQIAGAEQKRPSQARQAEARNLFLQALDTLDVAGVRFEKAEALVAAGSSVVFDVRKRLTYLFRAEEFYTRSGLTGKLDEVRRLINDLGRFERSPQAEAQPVAANPKYDYLTSCEAIKQIKSQLPRLTRPDLPVLITGETGVGKDHLARYFHSLVRPDGPFVAINCASVPDTLLESELFGYRRGAFTGAHGDKKGMFEAAHTGIFFLDEIGDMPLALQAKLLGVLESREITPLGGIAPIKIDFILVAATNQKLEEMVAEGSFRRDLYYRLSGINYHLPPLRERMEDIPLLLEYFMIRRNLLVPGQTPSPDLVQQFLAHDWPGNIRELDNAVNRLEIMSQSVADGDLNELARSILNPEAPPLAETGLFNRVEEFERKLIVEALLAARGNKSEAARMLGIHEATVRTKLKRYGISPEGSAVA